MGEDLKGLEREMVEKLDFSPPQVTEAIKRVAYGGL
jgi:hypothetical protein